MKELPKNYISQYKLLFYLSWIVLYFIFPAWRFPQIYISFADTLIGVPFGPRIVGYFVYFLIAAYLLDYCFKDLSIDAPLIKHSNGWVEFLKQNLLLVLVCCIAAVLHIFLSSPPLVGNAAYSLWIYHFMNSHWHKLLDFPIQYSIWLIIFLLVLILKRRRIVDYISSSYSTYRSNKLMKLLLMVFVFGVFYAYTQLIPDYSIWDHLFITGEPPLGTVLHLIIYLLFGAGNIYLAPVIVQFSFYILSGVFLYKTISLFCEKQTALLGASIYLFSPIIFTYATLGHLQSGVVFFIIITSYFFLKFIRDGHNNDLLLTAFFISVGSLYKREIILMLILCSAYLIVNKINQKDFTLKKQTTQIKILSLSLLSFLPWYFIGTRGADKIVLSHISTRDNLFSALLLIPTQLSWPIFSLFLLSIIFILFNKREKLPLFFLCVFGAYYVLYSALEQQTVHRYSMAFYPTIAVFLSQFIYSISQKVRWKHAFKIIFSVLIIYLAILCIVPRSSTKLITFKYTDFENQGFPHNMAEEWILNEASSDERALFLIRRSDEFNQRQKQISRERFYFLSLGSLLDLWSDDNLMTFRKMLREQCKELKISYIVFPVTEAEIMHPYSSPKAKRIMKFLKEDKYGDFIMTKKFNFDDNYIYIYKLKGGLIEKE